MTRQFKDPVHGYVDLDERIVERVVDTAPFQRLRRVRQLSATHLVYPGATHTRFEHSLGVYHLGQRVFENLRTQSYFTDGIGTEELDTVERTLAFACLLHDVGHPPLSHLGERHLDTDALRERLRGHGLVAAFDTVGVPSVDGLPVPIRRANGHELLGCVTVYEHYADAIEAFGVDPNEVCAYVLGWSLRYEGGDHWQHGVAAELLHSPIDVDRLDYIIRDDHMTGANVLSVDTERMVAAYTAHPNAGLALSEKALSTIGNYLEGRISLYMWVTQHHKSVYANVLVRRLLDELAADDNSPITADAVLDDGLDDHAVLDRFRRTAFDPPSEAFADLYERYRTRRFAESCWKHRLGYADVVAAEGEAAVDDYTRWLLDNDEFLERFLARELDVPVHEVWIERSYVPEYEPAELKDIPLAHNGRTQSVGEYGLYGDRAFDRSIPFVYVPKGHVDRTVELLNERYRDEW